jgi:hypothetical protein
MVAGFLTRKFWNGRHVLSLEEETQAREFVAEIADSSPSLLEGCDGVVRLGEGAGEEIPANSLEDLCLDNLHLLDRRFRTQVVKRAIFDIRADIGPLSNTPANQLVVAREYRKWAKARGLRPSHTETFRAYVMLGYFIKSEHDVRADVYAKSAAYVGQNRDRHRWSLLSKWRNSGWAPLEGSTAE